MSLSTAGVMDTLFLVACTLKSVFVYLSIIYLQLYICNHFAAVHVCETLAAVRVGFFYFGTDRVRVSEKIFRDGSGMDWVRVFSSYI